MKYEYDWENRCYPVVEIDDPITENQVCKAFEKGGLWNLTLADGRICDIVQPDKVKVIDIIGLTQIDKET